MHLAGHAGVRPSFADPARYVAVNVEGTANVLEAAHARGIVRVSAATSSSVYGNDTPLPAREEAACVEPASPYAASKRAMELVALACSHKMPELTFNALRFFTVYGPRQRPEMAITKFARAFLAGDTIPLFGDGSMRRDFTHVDDIFPDLLRFSQPLSGMIAGKKSLFLQLDFRDDYGVDIGILIDMHLMNARMREIEIGYLENKSKPWQALGKMSKEVAQTIILKAASSKNPHYNFEGLGVLNEIRSQMEFALDNLLSTLSKLVVFDMDNTRFCRVALLIPVQANLISKKS